MWVFINKYVLLLGISLGLFWGSSVYASDTGSNSVEIEYVAWYYKGENAFKRIAEYFGYGEQTGNKVLLRTQPGERAGLYFVLHLSDPADTLPGGSKFILSAVFPDSPSEKDFSFPLPESHTDYCVVWLGLTGKDVPMDEEAPVAWRIQITDGLGTILAEKASFLWRYEHPDEKS